MRNIKLIPTWIPREGNQIADFYSKLDDSDDWSIDHRTFNAISSRYGPFTVDRFSDDLNKKLRHFNSRYYVPGTSGVNAFTMNWAGENNWLCPPVPLIPAVIRHLRICGARGTLFVPVWPSAFFWPILYPDGETVASFVKHSFLVNPYYYTRSQSCVIFRGYQTFKGMALKISFSD